MERAPTSPAVETNVAIDDGCNTRDVNAPCGLLTYQRDVTSHVANAFQPSFSENQLCKRALDVA